MTGIASYGVYVPLWRLGRDIMAKTWDMRSLGGERSVANNDEDAITMAVEAVIDCLKGADRKEIDRLYFASNSSPYKEKECAALVATAADLRSDILTADFSGSLRAGTSALHAAVDAVKAGSAKKVIVVAADCRMGYPRSDYEQSFGDGAAAFLITDAGAVSIEATHSISNEMYDVWRLENDTYVRSWEDRFIVDEGYTRNMEAAVSGLIKKAGIAPASIGKAVLYCPTARAQQGLAKKVGLDVKQLQDPLIANVGITGCAHSLLMLAAALDEAKEGETLLMASYGNGADAWLLKVGGKIAKTGSATVKALIDSKKPLNSYIKYLSYRGVIETMPGEPFRLFPSATTSWRERAWALRMHASKCKKCGTVQFPIERICYNCGSQDNYDEVRLSDKKALVFSYSLDALAGRADDPMVAQLTVEFEEGKARTYLTATDCLPNEIAIGTPLEMTFRRMYEGAGMQNYYWKARPVRR